MKNYNLSFYRLKIKNRDIQRVAAYILSRFKNVLTMQSAASIYYDIYHGLKLNKYYDIDFNQITLATPPEEAQHAKYILSRLLDKSVTNISVISKWYDDVFDEYELKIDPITSLPCSAYDYIKSQKHYLSYFSNNIR